MTDVRYAPMAPGDEVAVNRAFNEVFGTERPLEEWAWKFTRSGVSPPAMLAWRASDLLAHYAGIPVRFGVDGRLVAAAQIVDVFSTSAGRRELSRRGTWVRTVERFFSEFGESGLFPLLYGFPGRRALRLGVLQLGYDALPPQPIEYLRRESAVPTEGLWRLGFRARLIQPDDERLDRLWARAGHRYPVAAVRDRGRLASRLGGHPTVRYHCFLVEGRLSGDAAGFVAFRTDGGTCRWVDLVWDGRPGALAQISHVGRRLASQTGAEYEELWLNGDAAALELLRLWGFATPGEPAGLVMVARSFDSTLDVGRMDGRVYLTMADADLV